MNNQFNTSNWTGRMHRTRNEAFGPYSDSYHQHEPHPISVIIGAVVGFLAFVATFWTLAAWF